MSTYYQLLEVPEQATSVELRQAYRRLVFLTHPDRTSDPEAHQRYLLINAAYEVLGQPTKRATYDAQLRAQRQHPQAATTPAQRDPAIRRRYTTAVQRSSGLLRIRPMDLEVYNAPARRWCQVLLGLVLVVMVDYFLLVRSATGTFTSIHSSRATNGRLLNYVDTDRGSFITNQHFPITTEYFQLKTSLLFRFVREARLPNGTPLSVEFGYESLFGFLFVLLLLTLPAQLRNLTAAMRINLAIIASVVGVIVLLMALTA